MFSVQYAVHLYGYFQGWRKNPQWSFSCCLALFLPLLDMAGDISGVAETNVVNTQLDTGHMEVTTIAGAVQDSGIIDVTLEENEQDENNEMVVEGDSCVDPRIQNVGAVHKITIPGAVKDSVATDVTLEVNPVEVEEGIGHGAGINNDKKCSQETQTELATISSPKSLTKNL